MTANEENAQAPIETTREDIPLKTGTKSTKWYNCTDECLSGSKFVNVAFGTLTIVITVALLIQIYYGDYQVVPHGSVATDSLECSRIGTRILKEGGNSVDAAIASAFCLAVVAPHVTGLDAEGQMLIYNHRTRAIPIVVDFSVPNIPSLKLPTLVLGLAYVHKEFGSLPWRNLVEPAAALARNGHLVTKMLVQAANQAKAQHLYGRLEPGQLLNHELLGSTLQTIANITEKELYSYIDSTNQPVRSQAIRSTFYNYEVYVPSLQSIGPILLVNLREINEYNFTEADVQVPQYYMNQLLDTTLRVHEEFNVSVKFHVGTASNVAVMGLDDNYVSLVTGMYEMFGDKELTDSGYVLNAKDKDKTCSRVPLIVTDSNIICGRRMALAANDMAMATQLLANLVIGNENATEAIEAPRFYVLSNGSIAIEGSHSPSFQSDILQYFEEKTGKKSVLTPEPYYSSNIVEKLKDDLVSHSDSRGGGIASRY